jgi:hypothetical protein
MALYAVEENRTYGAKNRVCLESDANAELSSIVRGIWDQREDGMQVEGALFARWSAWDGRRVAPTKEQSAATARGRSV